ncbi:MULTISPECIES: hypothetical protein [unclassified Burkholderia]|uniref:hypothetical protein n=1 Tax=unclassified Burkholderia TaxID=2613784 RepID=UPI0015C66AA3|nr:MULTISPECIES: hypothetical protein [unclassified Burkholderia]MDN7425239.1 hypothetical protein [Burkholderia sp. AU45388]
MQTTAIGAQLSLAISIYQKASQGDNAVSERECRDERCELPIWRMEKEVYGHRSENRCMKSQQYAAHSAFRKAGVCGFHWKPHFKNFWQSMCAHTSDRAIFAEMIRKFFPKKS